MSAPVLISLFLSLLFFLSACRAVFFSLPHCFLAVFFEINREGVSTFIAARSAWCRVVFLEIQRSAALVYSDL